MSTPVVTAKSTFATDVEQGLTQQPKTLSSKYFYDEQGDVLFQAIMAMPSYYLTNCEYDIFAQQADGILQAIGTHQAFEIIELGAGDGTKTKLLLEHFLQQEAKFTYRPIDISGNVLEQLVTDCAQRWPQLEVDGVEGDYFSALQSIVQEDNGLRKVVLFLGGNIGNFPQTQAQQFLSELNKTLQADDLVLIGFDLKKDPAIIQAAYDDKDGVTAQFNLNLLRRINRELGGNFNLSQWKHWETYNPVNGEARSYLISKTTQTVNIDQLNISIHFDAWEAIHVEISAKYSLQEIADMAEHSGFNMQEHFTDNRQYFVDSLWRKV